MEFFLQILILVSQIVILFVGKHYDTRRYESNNSDVHLLRFEEEVPLIYDSALRHTKHREVIAVELGAHFKQTAFDDEYFVSGVAHAQNNVISFVESSSNSIINIIVLLQSYILENFRIFQQVVQESLSCILVQVNLTKQQFL